MEYEYFRSKTDRFYEAGLISDVYKDDKIIILNAYDKFYLACPLEFIDEKNIGGFITVPKYINNYIEDYTFFYRAIQHADKKKLTNTAFPLNDRTYEWMMEDRKKLEGQLPSKYVDKMLEEEIKSKYSTKTM